MSSAAPRISYINLGCRVNRVELDDIALALEAYGCTPARETADVVVVNSCIVTAEAQAKTRKAVRRAAAHSPEAPVVVTGCASTLFAEELSGLHEHVIVEPDKEKVAPLVLTLLGLGGAEVCSAPALESVTPTGRTRPGVKVQDGCDCRCSFCIVWKARGASRSVAYQDVLERVRAAQARGAREVVLTGINLGRYEMPAPGAEGTAGAEGAEGAAPAVETRGLDLLLERLLADTDVERFRLSSIEPQDMTQAVVDVIAGSNGRIAPFVHLPLQSGSDAVLSRMKRDYTTADYRAVVERVRASIPDAAICCDYIVGFPGETEAEFEEGLAFCESIGFSRMHIFRYSKRPGTPAAIAPDQVPPQVMASRAAKIRELADRMHLEFARSLVGTRQLLVVQDRSTATDGHLMDVRVAPELETGTLVEAELVSVDAEGILDARL